MSTPYGLPRAGEDFAVINRSTQTREKIAKFSENVNTIERVRCLSVPRLEPFTLLGAHVHVSICVRVYGHAGMCSRFFVLAGRQGLP